MLCICKGELYLSITFVPVAFGHFNCKLGESLNVVSEILKKAGELDVLVCTPVASTLVSKNPLAYFK